MNSSTSASSTTKHPETTIWIWPSGLFPRRLMYYFRAKHITLSTLRSHNINIIPVTLQSSGALAALPGYEARLPNTSLPCMRIERPGEENLVVHESMAILEYLEEIFSESKGYIDVRGSTLEQRSKMRDILSVFNDAFSWSNVALIHSDPSTTSWSGLNLADQSSTAAADAKKRFHHYLSKIEKWIEADVAGKGTNSLAGEGPMCTLADIIFMTTICYLEEVYRRDWIEEHGVLRVWCDRAKEQSWFISVDELTRCERDGWEVVLDV